MVTDRPTANTVSHLVMVLPVLCGNGFTQPQFFIGFVIGRSITVYNVLLFVQWRFSLYTLRFIGHVYPG